MIFVELENIKTGARESFRFESIAPLFKLEAQIKQQCWKLPADSPYIYQDGKLIRKSVDNPNQNSQKRTRNIKSTIETTTPPAPHRTGD